MSIVKLDKQRLGQDLHKVLESMWTVLKLSFWMIFLVHA